MAVDIVIPDGNEETFKEMAEELGYDDLIFLYTQQPETNPERTAYLAEKQNQVGKHQNKYDHILAEGAKWAFQDKRVDAVFNLEKADRDDFIHHRASGINQVLAKEASKTNTKVVFNFSLLHDQEQRNQVLGRMMQNVEICRKYDINMKIATFAVDPYEMRAPKDLQSFGETIGMHAETAQNALEL